jgi:hypothetical protein
MAIAYLQIKTYSYQVLQRKTMQKKNLLGDKSTKAGFHHVEDGKG